VTQTGTIACKLSDCSDTAIPTSRPCAIPECCNDTSWDPPTTSYCLYYPFSQTSNCENVRTAYGTKDNCEPDHCRDEEEPYLFCQNNDLYGKYDYWDSEGCNVNTCLGRVIWNSCGDYKEEECGNDECFAGDPNEEYEYCQDGNIWHKYRKILRGCGVIEGGNGCYENDSYCNEDLKKACEVGYTCKAVDSRNAECVSKSTTWTEI